MNSLTTGAQTYGASEHTLEIRAGCLEAYDKIVRDIARLEEMETSSPILIRLGDELDFKLQAIRGSLAASSRLLELENSGQAGGDAWKKQLQFVINNFILAEDGR